MVDPNIHGKSHGKIDSAVLAHFLCRFFSYDSQSLKRFFFFLHRLQNPSIFPLVAMTQQNMTCFSPWDVSPKPEIPALETMAR